MPGGPNVRRSPRYQIVLPAICQAASGGATANKGASGWTRNLSETGGCLELTEPLAAGTSLRLVLVDEGGSLALEASVVWVGHPRLPSGGTLHGVGFLRLSPDQRRALRALLQRKGGLRAGAARIPAALPVQCRPLGASDAPLSGWTGDLSRDGCLLLLPDQLPVGTLIEVTLTTPRGEFTAKATVVWAEKSARIRTRQFSPHGARFVEAGEVWDNLLGMILDAIPAGVVQGTQAD